MYVYLVTKVGVFYISLYCEETIFLLSLIYDPLLEFHSLSCLDKTDRGTTKAVELQKIEPKVLIKKF